MTCIVGIEHEGKVYLGSDAAAVDGLDVCTITDAKSFINCNVGIGFAGSFRAGQILKYAFVPPTQRKTADFEYLVVDFVDVMRETLASKGVLKKENEIEELDLSALIALNGKLYWLESDFQIGKPTRNFHAVGCGDRYALGALSVLQEHTPDLAPEEKLKIALSVAATHSAGVRPPFTIVCIDGKTKKNKKTEDGL